jgi:TolB-like protein/class 3 adenylate cyclase/Flp pilus assembly protein TadD
LAEEQRRLAAIMFTDLVGYTALTQSSESQAIEVLERHNTLVRPFFTRFHGREVKAIGDSFLVEFESALDALRCAVEIESYLHDYNVSSRDEWKITLRIGIHLGDVVHREGDVFGDAVNIASRIEPLAEPEGICLSEHVYSQVRNKFDLPLVSLGKKSLKNVNESTEVYKVIMPWRTMGEERQADTPAQMRRVAILPFRNMSPDPSDEYFAEGMTEELIAAVSKVPSLSVISRTSVMGYKDKGKKATEIANELNVGTLLEGSVRKAANRVRITVQLIDATNDRHLWAENYDRSVEDVFAVQSDVAEKVASSLNLRLTERDRKKIEAGGTANVEAHTLYLKGSFNLLRWDKSSVLAAMKHFEDAIGKDPDYALAYCGLVGANSKLLFLELADSDEARRKAEKYAQKALELDYTLPEAHLRLGVVLMNDYDFTGGRREFLKAIELNPNLAEAYSGLAANYAFFRRWEDCAASIEKALELDPLSVATSGSAGTWNLYMGRYDEAVKHLRNSLELDPNNSFNLVNLGLAYIRKGMVEEGLAMVKRAAEMAGEGFASPDLAWAYMKAGRPEEVEKLLARTLAQTQGKATSPTIIAGIYSVMGEKDKAVEWLEKAFDQRSGYLPATNADFVYENVHGDPRFQALMARLGLAPSG